MPVRQPIVNSVLLRTLIPTDAGSIVVTAVPRIWRRTICRETLSIATFQRCRKPNAEPDAPQQQRVRPSDGDCFFGISST